MKKLGLVFCIWVLVLLGGCTLFATEEVETTVREVTLHVIHADKRQVTFSVSSDAVYLGEAFAEEGIFSGREEAYGLFVTTVDGETMDEDKEEWWCLTKAGEVVATGIDKTPFAQGDVFELTLTVGY